MPRHRIQSSRIINIYFSKMNYFSNFDYIYMKSMILSLYLITDLLDAFFWIIRDIGLGSVKVWGGGAGVYIRTYLAIYMFMLHVPVPF